MDPTLVVIGHQLEYSKLPPGGSTGSTPTTPGPVTFSTSPSAFVMIHCRDTSFAVSDPTFVMRTWYWKTNERSRGELLSGTNVLRTWMRMPRVVVSLISQPSIMAWQRA